MADSVVKNANKEQYDEDAIFDRLLDETLEPDVVDLREEQYEGMAPPLFDVDVDDITYEAPTELPMRSEGIRSIGLESGGNAGIETLKQTTIQLQEMPPDRNMTVLQRMMKQAGAPAQDPKLLAQVSQVLGRDV
ncbi:MAG: hypothetical protein VXW76_01810 [Actinomycetota bacterium]|nr:hypothetical protein [Actinomycetota bacterium]MEC7530895.1 hypothetical protein [Actinomycetota bacterium]